MQPENMYQSFFGWFIPNLKYEIEKKSVENVLNKTQLTSDWYKYDLITYSFLRDILRSDMTHII